MIDAQTVDEIFLMVPDILHIHQQFLDELRRRLEHWDPHQRVGDAFVQVVIDCFLHLFQVRLCSSQVVLHIVYD